MKSIKTFEQFVSSMNEDTIKAGPESEVEFGDVITKDGVEISSEELLGLAISSETEGEFKDKLYDKFGQDAFSEEDMSKAVAMYNDYQAEQKEKEKEAEKEAEGAEGGDAEDPLAGL